MAEWRKSSHSGGGNDDACVEAASLAGGIGIRDSKNREAGHLEFRSGAFAGLLRRVKRDEFRR